LGASLRRDKHLYVTARLIRVDASERRVILTQQLVTADSHGNAVEVEQVSIVRRAAAKPAAEKPREKEDALISEAAREVASFHAHERSGLEYAFFSGDFNPIHWLKPYARSVGFKGPILHGFAQLGRVYEGMRKNIFCGRIDPLSEISIRFERPLYLPQACRVYLSDDGEYFLGAAPGALAIARGKIGERDMARVREG
jgi:acyl dehydratase